MLVSMLTTSSRARKPFNTEICLRPLQKWVAAICFTRGRHRHGHGRRVHPTTSFVRRHALDSMSSSFVLETRKVFARNRQAHDVEPASGAALHRPVTLSAEGFRQAFVRAGKLAHEQLGVVAALGGPDFDCQILHGTILSNVRILDHAVLRSRGARSEEDRADVGGVDTHGCCLSVCDLRFTGRESACPDRGQMCISEISPMNSEIPACISEMHQNATLNH